jgi:cytochrome P450
VKLPPGLSTPPLLQTLQLVANPIGFFERCGRDYGDVFTARVLGLNSPPVVFLGHPEAVKAVFTAPPGQFELGKVTHVFRPLTGDKSLIMMDGEQHQRQRKLLMPPLHGDRMALYGETICNLTQDLIADIPKNQVFSIRKLMAEITLDTILQVVFGVAQGERYQELKTRIGGMLEAITNPVYSSFFFFPPLQQDWGAWSPWGHFTRSRHRIDTLVYAEIAERRQQDYTQRSDILSLLMSAKDENGESMSDQELRDQLMTLLLLGHETTASSLAWAFYWIYSTPHVLEKLQQELAMAQDNPAQNFPQLPYLNAVCAETLRLYPIALISQPRIVKEPLTWQDYYFESGTILVPCIYLAHHRREQFPNSHSFQPERFLQEKITAYEYFPFGGGSRACIGSAFSLFEMKLVLGTIISNLSLKLFNPDRIKPVRRGITIVPAGGVEMLVIPSQKER